MAIMRPPINTPNTDMMMGSISELRLSTALSTAASQWSATFASISSREPDSSPIVTIWSNMEGNSPVVRLDRASGVPASTSSRIRYTARAKMAGGARCGFQRLN